MASVLLVVGRQDPMRQCVSRGVMLARLLRARLDILLLDDAFETGSGSVEAAVQSQSEAHQLLDAMRRSVQATDVEIATDVALGHSPAELVTAKASSVQSQLVIKCFGDSSDGPHAASRWSLVRSCPAPLLLTRCRPWHPRARFAAALHSTDGLPRDAAESLVSASVALGAACGAELDLLSSESSTMTATGAIGTAAGHAHAQLAHAFQIAPQRVHRLGGMTDTALPVVAAAREFDLIGFFAAPDLSNGVALQRLAKILASALNCDFLFVKAAITAKSQ